MQTECLIVSGPAAVCEVRVRFLHIVTRSDVRDGDGAAEPWQEAAEEQVEVPEFDLPSLVAQPMQCPFRVAAKRERSPVTDASGKLQGETCRERKPLSGMIELSANQIEAGLFRLRVVVANTTPMDGQQDITRDGALALALVSAHTVLEIRGGEFVSLTDPPEQYRQAAAECVNTGTWPILVGEEGEKTTLLSSPIILSDYPQIAPESPGDLFDGAEIDEILSLRILTMTDKEKREMRETDERARQILERTESLPPEHFLKLHGVIRGLRPAPGESR
jgi:hypothetical protein